VPLVPAAVFLVDRTGVAGGIQIQRAEQVAVGLAITGVQRHGPLVAGNPLRRLPLVDQGAAQVIVGPRVVRPQLERLLVAAPRQVELAGSAPVASIAVGQDHVLALTRHGVIYAWGRNHRGQLGDGTTTDRAASVQVPVPDAVQVAAGNAGSAALTASGAAVIWGRALPGQAGLAGAAPARPRPLTLPPGTIPVMVDAGQRHLVVLTSHGELLTFGADPGGRPLRDSLPLDPSWGHVESISAGDNHTVALTDTGVVLAWGANSRGQLGTRDTANRQAPVQVQIPELGGGSVVELIAGGDSVLARTSEHQVYAWGHGGFGQNGNGSTADQTRPQPVPTPAEATVTGIHTGRYHCLTRTGQHH